jgi:hypothetical protein
MHRALRAFVLPLILVAAAPLALAQTFSVTGAGGTFPTSTVGVDGNYPHATQQAAPSLPPNVLSTTVTVPANATRITKVVIRGFFHPWSGDAHFVLKDPAGARYNLSCPVNNWNSTLYGNSCDFGTSSAGSDYEFVDPSVAPQYSFPPNAATSCNGAAGVYHEPGTYNQYFNNGNGAWPSSSPQNLGILNTPLHSIPVAPGTWTLECMDWYLAADSGSFASWELQGDTVGPPMTFCTAGTSSSGCVPSIGASAHPSVSLANPCTITVAGVEGQKSGLIFYGVDNTGFSPLPWGTGSSFLCVKPPTQRTPAQSSGGTSGACNGAFLLDWNAFRAANPGALGQPWMVGESVFAQSWYRDPPAPKTTNLSDAVSLAYQP